MILTASLQVDGFTSEIDSEIAEIRAVHNGLTDRQNKAVQFSSLGGVIGTAAGAVGSALALVGDTAATVGNYFGAAGGGLGTVFGFLGYFEQLHGPKGCFPEIRETKSPSAQKALSGAGGDPPPGAPENTSPEQKKKCDKLAQQPASVQCPMPDATNKPCDPKSPSPSKGCSPRMLYQLIFGPQCGKGAAGFHSWYDETIQEYLAGEPEQSTGPSNGQLEKKPSRRDALIETWGGESGLRKQTELFTSNKNPYKLSISNLEDRANKLADLRTVVARMNRDLSRLTEDLAKELRCPVGGPPEDRYWSSMDRTSGK